MKYLLFLTYFLFNGGYVLATTIIAVMSPKKIVIAFDTKQKVEDPKNRSYIYKTQRKVWPTDNQYFIGVAGAADLPGFSVLVKLFDYVDLLSGFEENRGSKSWRMDGKFRFE